MQQTKIAKFAVTKSNGIVTQIGRTIINQPRTNFSGGSVKWLKDKAKQKSN